MAALWRSLGNMTQATNNQTKREGLPNLEELLWKNAPLRNSFQSEESMEWKDESRYSSEGSERKTSSEYCPSTPSQGASPSIEQFYFGMDHESPTLTIDTAVGKEPGQMGVLGDHDLKASSIAQTTLLASLTSILNSRHDHYAAAMNAAHMDRISEYDDVVYDSDYEEYDDDFLDDDYELATIEIATIISFSRPASKPKLVDIRPAYVDRSPSVTESTSRYSNSSGISKLYSEYSWTGENSSDISDVAEAVSEDEYHDTAEVCGTCDGEPLQEDSAWPSVSASTIPEESPLPSVPTHGTELSQFLTSSTTLDLSFPTEHYHHQQSPNMVEQTTTSNAASPAAIKIPSRSSSRLHTKPSKQKPKASSGLRHSSRSYSLFPLRSR